MRFAMPAQVGRFPAPSHIPFDPPSVRLHTSPSTASRGDLSWQITIPDRGQMPDGGAHPMCIDWGGGPYPSDRLTDHGLRLSRLILPVDRMPLADPRIRPGKTFSAVIATPRGEVVL